MTPARPFPPRTGRTPARLAALGLGVGAVAFVIGLVVGDLTSASDDTTLQAPTSTPPVGVTASSTTTTVASTTSSTTFEALGPDGGPTEVVAATVDGRLVALDLDTGEELVLDQVTSHPDATGFGRIQLSADRSVAYYAVMTGPFEGFTAMVPTDGTAQQGLRVADGVSPALSSDDAQLMTVGPPSAPGVVVTDLSDGGTRTIPDSDGRQLRHPTWVPDGSSVAFAEVVEEGLPSVLVLVNPGADDLTGSPVRIAPDGGGWTLPIWRDLSQLWLVDQCCGSVPSSDRARFFVADPEDDEEDEGPGAATPPVAQQEYDANGRWLVYVTTDGVARWAGAGQNGEIGPGYVAADW